MKNYLQSSPKTPYSRFETRGGGFSRRRTKWLSSLLPLLLLLSTAYVASADPAVDNQEERLLIEILDEVSREHQIYFTYDSDIIKGVTVDYEKREGESVRSILMRVLAEVDMDFKIFEERFVILYSKDEVGLKSLEQMISHMEEIVKDRKKVFANRRVPPVARLNTDKWSDVNRKRLVLNVTGRVMDANGEPLIGVNVQVKGTNKGTATDIDGRFSFSDIDDKAVLVVSYIGYKTQEIALDGQTSLTIVMQEDAQTLDEVVVVGYGTQKKVNLTGAVDVVSKEVFENKSVPDAIAAIQGKIPGVMVTKTSGKPGSENYNMQIRGASSINSVGVLTIIDGVKGNLSDLNPNDIESMSVLKDAAASAIYGSNAAGGVILVTTKKGKAGKTTVEYRGMYGVTKMGRLPTPASAYDQMNTLAIGNRNAGVPNLQWESPVRLAWLRGERLDETDYVGANVEIFPTGRFFVTKGRPNVWQSANSINQIKELTKEYNPVQTHNISVTGGNDKNRYYISGGYYNRRGILRYGPDLSERYNLRLNTNNDLSKKIRLNTWAVFSNKNTYQPSTSAESILNYAMRFWSSGVTYGPTGDYFASHGLWPSYVQVMKEGGKNTQEDYSFDGKSEMIIEDILPGLRFNVIGGVKYENGKNFANNRTLTYYGPEEMLTTIHNTPNSMSKSQSLSRYISFQSFATYDLSIMNSHNFTLLGGYSYEDYRYEGMIAGAKNLVTNEFYSLEWGDPATKSNSDQISSWATKAAFGRLNYNYKEKYLFEANMRYDGSSRLAPETRWHYFPSLSAGWNISNETFFENVNLIQDLKIRGSWGQLGNSNALGLYDYISLLDAGNNLPFNDSRTQYVTQNTLASESKTWETIETANIGIDLTAFNGKLAITADAYIKNNKNMLVDIEVPSILGVGVSSYNYGEMETKGWDISLGWKEESKRFQYWVNISLSDNKNKLIKYDGKDIVSAGQVKLIEGLQLNTMWGYKTDGLFQDDQEYMDDGVFINPNTGAGDMKYLDLNSDGKISVGDGTLKNPGDLVRLGDTNPRYLFGIDFGFRWKGMDFSAFLQGVGKRLFSMQNGDMWNSMYVAYADAVNLPFEEQMDYWTPENPDAFYPRPYKGSLHSYWPSDYWMQDAAYIRLKNIEIGYAIPPSITQKAHISKSRVFISGRDLWEATNTFSWVDPESADNSGVFYPFYRSISLGINITF